MKEILKSPFIGSIIILNMLLTTLIVLSIMDTIDSSSAENMFSMIIGSAVGAGSATTAHKVAMNGYDQRQKEGT